MRLVAPFALYALNERKESHDEKVEDEGLYISDTLSVLVRLLDQTIPVFVRRSFHQGLLLFDF